MIVIVSTNSLLLFSSYFFSQKLLNQESNPNSMAIGSGLGLQNESSCTA